jgi:hypothetical protein
MTNSCPGRQESRATLRRGMQCGTRRMMINLNRKSISDNSSLDVLNFRLKLRLALIETSTYCRGGNGKYSVAIADLVLMHNKAAGFKQENDPVGLDVFENAFEKQPSISGAPQGPVSGTPSGVDQDQHLRTDNGAFDFRFCMSALINICLVAIYIVFSVPPRKTTAAFSGVLAGVSGATAAPFLHVRTISSAVIYCCIFCTDMFKVLTYLVRNSRLLGDIMDLKRMSTAKLQDTIRARYKLVDGLRYRMRRVIRGCITCSSSRDRCLRVRR